MPNINLSMCFENFAEQFAFSNREREVFNALLDQGVPEEQIATNLGVTRNTVRNHFQNIFEKAGCNSKSELMAKFIKSVFNRQGLRVLVVEDQPVESEHLKNMLEKLGINADIASDGVAGLAKFRENDYDLVISDLLLPKMDGNEMIRQIRSEKPFIPIIAISGDEATLEAAGQTGVNIMWLKPLTKTNLFSAIAKLPS